MGNRSIACGDEVESMNESKVGKKKKTRSTVDVGGGRSERTKRTTAKMCFVFVTVVKCPGLKKAAREFKGLNWSRRNGAVGLNSLSSPPCQLTPL